MKTVFGLLSGLCLLTMSGQSVADDKWEVKVNMAMTGMPFAIPQQTHIICAASTANEQARLKMIPTEEGCTTSQIKSSPSSMSVHIECPTPNKMSGDMKMTYTANSYKGEMTARSHSDGYQGDIKITYIGKKIGTCAASENTALQAKQQLKQQQTMMAQQQANQDHYMSTACAQMANEMNIQTVTMMSQTCPNLKTDICQAFKVKTSNPTYFKQLKLEKGEYLGEIATYCNVDAQIIEQQACTAAKNQKLWLEASEFCGEDSDLAMIAAKECTGLSFTSMPTSDPRRSYMPLCSRYAQKAQTNPRLIDSGTKALDGINKLRGLFGH